MDQAAVLKILQDNGARPTPENINRLMQSSEMYGRALGLQGGMDESGPTPMMLDKLIKNTSTPAQMPVSPGGENINPAQSSVAVPNTVPSSTATTPTQAAATSNRRPRGMSVNTEPPSGTLGMDINKLIAPPTDTAAPERGPSNTIPPHEPGMQINGNVDAALGDAPMSMKDYALAAGIPLGTAAVGYALFQKLAALDGTVKMQPSDIAMINNVANDPKVLARLDDLYPQGQGPEHKARLMEMIKAENAALGLGPKPSVNTGTAAVDKVAADTAKPAAKPTRAPPRTAVPGMTAGPIPVEEVAGPNRNPAVVNDGKARAEKAKSDAALKTAEKPQPVPPAKATGPVESIKDLPYSKPVDPNTLPSKGPVEPMPNRSSNAFIDLLNAVRKLAK